jgi:hypothetical protein
MRTKQRFGRSSFTLLYFQLWGLNGRTYHCESAQVLKPNSCTKYQECILGISTMSYAQAEMVSLAEKFIRNTSKQLIQPTIVVGPSHPCHSAIKIVGSAAVVGTDPGVAPVVSASRGPVAVAVAVVARSSSVLLRAFALPVTKPTEL